MIQEVKEQAYGALFRGHIKRDFPRRERRPLYLLRRLHKHGMYTLLAMRDDASGRLLAYAGLLHATTVDTMLLDYLAVVPEHRGSGIGSCFMEELVSHCDTDGILIECESPAQATNAEEKRIRERRIQFYQRNGAIMTCTGWHFIGVHYDLLFLPVHKMLDGVDVAGDIPRLYSAAVPQPLMQFASKVLEKETREK